LGRTGDGPAGVVEYDLVFRFSKVADTERKKKERLRAAERIVAYILFKRDNKVTRNVVGGLEQNASKATVQDHRPQRLVGNMPPLAERKS